MGSIYLSNIEDIYDSRTRDNLREVISSCSNDNNRAAITMLYCTVVADVVYKLQELRDRYSIASAANLLEKMENCLESARSDWEWEICRAACEDLQLYNAHVLNEIQYLKSKRNFAAHPALDNNYELISPSQDEVIALIKFFLIELFTQGAFIQYNIVSQMAEDLALSSDFFRGAEGYEELCRYLTSKYYARMHDTRLQATFKALWKFCFVLTDDNCSKNRTINRLALQALADYAGPVATSKWLHGGLVKDMPVSPDKSCVYQATLFFALNPGLFQYADDRTKPIIKSRVKTDYPYLGWLAVDEEGSDEEIIEATRNHLIAKSSGDTAKQWDTFDGDAYYVMKRHCKACGLYPELLNAFLAHFNLAARSYHDAEEAYITFIRPSLEDLDGIQSIELLRIIDKNDQIYPAWRIGSDMDNIVAASRNAIERDNLAFLPKSIENIHCATMEQWCEDVLAKAWPGPNTSEANR